MVHIGSLYKTIEKLEFSIAFVKENGEVIQCTDCICTSFYSKGKTLNIKLLKSGQVRKIRRATIINFNGEEAYL